MADFSTDDIRRAAELISPHIRHTPLLSSPMLDEAAGARVYVKAESLQLTGSFKVRGALNKILGMSPEARAGGVAAYSAGNHAAAVAAAAHLSGIPAVIVVPRGAPEIKVSNCAWWGAEVVFYDPETQDRAEVTGAIAAQRGMTIVPPFDDLKVMAGAGTAGLELIEQLQEEPVTPDAVVVNCSGGGLASGVITAVAEAFPSAERYIVEPQGGDKMAKSLAAGTPVPNPAVRKTVMDGISGPAAGKLPLDVLLSHGVTGLTVSDEQALHAVASAFNFLKTVLEPAGAASVAAVLSRQDLFAGKNVALIASGGNIDPSMHIRALRENA